MADKIVAEYIVKTDEAVKNLNRLEKEVKELSAKGKKSATDIESNFSKTSSSLISQFSKVGAALGIAFGAQQLVAFGKEAVNLAAKAEGVERAFKRIGSADLLKDLREATRGTVTDLQLMQRAVQASNFKIPLDQLAGLLKFAQARARETGESVDYLVDSIVLGIGRKSPLILDNLGISAVELRDRLKGVGVEATSVADIAKIVGQIATEELAKMGDQADTTADAIERLSTTMENLKVDSGKTIIVLLEDIAKAYDFLTGKLRNRQEIVALNEAFKEGTLLANKTIENIEKQAISEELRVKAIEQYLDQADKLYDAEQENIDIKREAIEVSNFSGIAGAKRLKDIQKEISTSDELSETYLAQIDVFSKYLDKIKELNKPQSEQIRNVFFLKNAIKELTDEVNSEGIAREKIAELLPKIKALEEELALLLGKETDEQKKLREELEKIAKIREQVFTGAEMAEGIPVVNALSSTLNGLNELLKEQRDILNSSPEFSKQYDDASDAIDRLQKKIDSFNDNFIDPSNGNPDSAPNGSQSATGLGLFSNDSKEGNPWISEEDIAELQQYADIAIDILNGITQAVIAGHDAELNSLESQLESGLISREKYDEERRKIERKKAIDQKNAAIFDAVIATALAVATALTVAPPLGFVLAGIAGALGAVQIGVIASQPLPQFAEGGWVDSKGKIHGRKHSQGGVKLEAEGDEFIIKGAIAKQNASLLESLNAGNGQDWINKNMVYPAIQNLLDSGLESNSGNWGNVTANLKDHNIIASQDRMRQSMTNGFKYLAKELKGRNIKRGGYNA